MILNQDCAVIQTNVPFKTGSQKSLREKSHLRTKTLQQSEQKKTKNSENHHTQTCSTVYPSSVKIKEARSLD